MEFFWNQNFFHLSFMHKRNFNPKVIYKLFLIKLFADVTEYFQPFSAGNYFLFFTDFEMQDFLTCHFISFLAWKKPIQLFQILFYFIFLMPKIRKCFLINLRYRTVHSYLKWQNLCGSIETVPVCRDFHQLHEIAIYTSSQGGYWRWQSICKLAKFPGLHFPDLNPNSYDNLNKMKLDFNTSTKQGQI